MSADSSRLELEAVFPALTPEALFDHFIQPALLERWWPQSAETDPQEGGEYHLSWSAMDWSLRGTYKRFEPGRALTFTWSWDHEPDRPERLVELEISPEGAGSRLCIVQGTYGDSVPEQEDRQGHRDGWIHFLGQLEASSRHLP